MERHSRGEKMQKKWNIASAEPLNPTRPGKRTAPNPLNPERSPP